MRRSRRNWRLIGCAMFLMILLAASASGEIPRKINYQGRLTDAGSGEPMAGSQDMVFRIYDASDGGGELWSESATVQADSAGIFSVVLGKTTPMSLSFDAPVWLQVEVGGEVLSPRREIVSVPFAFRAMNCDSLDGVPSDSVWTAINDGAYSGMDADKVDGYDALAFADSGHVHDHRYVHRDSLGTEGLVNNGSNPVDWTRLKGVPGGFADGTDDVGGSGDGHSLDAADGDPVDAVFVDNEGYVGIGTTGPAERLHLTGPTSRILVTAGTSDPEIGFASPVDAAEEVWRIYKHKGSGDLRFAQDGDRMSITYQNGNVGIGTTSAGEKLVVDGSVNLSEHLMIDGSTVLSVDGTANTLLGAGAGPNNTASGNTFVGSGAGYLNGLGFDNVFVGDSSGFTNTQGFYNVFVGNTAGFSNTFGQDNAFVGARAGWANDLGSWNTFLGAHAGSNNDDATSNTFVGAGAGSGTVSGSDNTFVGHGAGGGTVAGNGNTSIGSFAGPMSGDAGGNVFIGYMAGLNETGSDKLLIANGPEDSDALIYGDFSNGRVGIGTLDPETRLHVSSPTSNFGMLRVENSNTGDNEATIGFRPGSDATGAETWVAGVGAWGETGDFVIGIEEPRMVITSYGAVGIGETFPTNQLEVKRSSTCWIDVTADGGSGVAGIGLANDNGGWEIDCRGDMSDVLAFIRLSAFVVPAMVIEPDGNVGIGLDDPQRKLHIKGTNARVLIESTSGSSEVNFMHTGDAGTDVWAIYKDDPSGDLRFYQNGNKVWIKGGSGNVGIGGDPDGNKLYVNGTACGTSYYTTCSDRNLKRDIRGVTGALDKVMSLEGVSFLWRTDEYEDRNFDSGRHYGLIAQDVEAVLPEVVTEGAEGEMAVAYAEIIPVLIEAMKAQQGRIEVLEGRLAELESQ